MKLEEIKLQVKLLYNLGEIYNLKNRLCGNPKDDATLIYCLEEVILVGHAINRIISNLNFLLNEQNQK